MRRKNAVNFDAKVALNRAITKKRIYAAVDPLTSTSTMLAKVYPEHRRALLK